MLQDWAGWGNDEPAYGVLGSLGLIKKTKRAEKSDLEYNAFLYLSGDRSENRFPRFHFAGTCWDSGGRGVLELHVWRKVNQKGGGADHINVLGERF